MSYGPKDFTGEIKIPNLFHKSEIYRPGQPDTLNYRLFNMGIARIFKGWEAKRRQTPLEGYDPKDIDKFVMDLTNDTFEISLVNVFGDNIGAAHTRMPYGTLIKMYYPWAMEPFPSDPLLQGLSTESRFDAFLKKTVVYFAVIDE